jgi:protoporphyrinogen oxidase
VTKTAGPADRVAVLGGGVAGVTAAAVLAAEGGCRVRLFEKRDRLGGLQRTETVDGISFDIGAFLFEPDYGLPECMPMLKRHFVRFRERICLLAESSRMYSYPPDYRMVVAEDGWRAMLAVVLDFGLDRVRLRGARESSLEASARWSMGDYLYRRSGLKQYVERLNRLPGSMVGAKFARQRFPRLEARQLARAAVHRLSVGRGRADPSYRTLRTRRGFGPVFDDAAEVLRGHGVRLELSSKVGTIRREGSGFVVGGESGEHEFDMVVSTIPVSEALRAAGMEPAVEAETLALRSLFFRAPFFGGWTLLYNHTCSGEWKRLVRHAPLEGEGGTARFTAEITVRDAGSEDPEAAWADTLDHLRRHGVFDGPVERVGTVLTPDAYPLFRAGGEAAVDGEVRRLEKLGIATLGRQGRHDYLVSSEAFGSARRLARRMIGRGD